MGYKPSKAQRLVLTLTLDLETDTGGRCTQWQMAHASNALIAAVKERLFAEGFLPPDTCIDRYDLTVD